MGTSLVLTDQVAPAMVLEALIMDQVALVVDLEALAMVQGALKVDLEMEVCTVACFPSSKRHGLI